MRGECISLDFLFILIGPVPAYVVILEVGAMAGDGRQRAKELMVNHQKKGNDETPRT